MTTPTHYQCPKCSNSVSAFVTLTEPPRCNRCNRRMKRQDAPPKRPKTRRAGIEA